MTNPRDEARFDPVSGSLRSYEHSTAGDWVRQYVLDELPEPQRSRFEEHFFNCPTCSDRVLAAYLLLRGTEATLQPDRIQPGSRPGPAGDGTKSPKPQVAPRARRLRFAPLALSAAAILAVISGYQNFSVIPALRLQRDLANAPQSSPILQLSETRSEMSTVKKSAGQVSAILSNVGARPFSAYICELRGQSDKLVWTFNVPAVQGDEWELRIPLGNLQPDRYTLRVRGAEDARDLSESSVSEYHFAVKD